MLPETLITTVLQDAYATRAESDCTVNLLVLTDEAIAEMNWQHLQHKGPTDVLSFDDGEPDPETKVLHLGDIAISLDTARREAEARQLEADHELTLYALHGLLHLLGMRDHTDETRAEMIEAQREAFARHELPFCMEDR